MKVKYKKKQIRNFDKVVKDIRTGYHGVTTKTREIDTRNWKQYFEKLQNVGAEEDWKELIK